ncbi:U32 family peptidase [Megalodesulfovibrio gigas]|uniref:Putative peptidase U32 n=1 Tax=Megalodesulfovibrio gigas (strain ATCC 19364 / DSM 1382 / NCIMB 9332 / VKM B-1759) TaxID=1121448 RepID=T2GD99_MEGG1|nr:U32 family peptidase [Megalodesulfovibrio gigas]AGW14288.1 putative peptidase U32 [Megalodesulfovibrio gigas DSM 1382 = ATCC 19364]
MTVLTTDSTTASTGSVRPEILAPAGQPDAFLAAVAAGADAVYAGLKHFSARMQADNFAVKELAALSGYAREKGVKTYLALNTMLKPGDLDAAGRMLDRVAKAVQPAGVIVQDLGAVQLLRQIEFPGEIHLSTLAAVSPMAGLRVAKEMGVRRVVLAREFHVDEMKAMDTAAAELDMDLEAFVHGALCFCVSGRCYWSSYMGGKSGLRGRCVQPCRRRYSGKGVHGSASEGGRVFSCLDLSLDVLAKTLLQFPRIKAWKIEGRKKGPHYAFYAVTAYKMLRDHSDDPAARKEALAILERALGRQGSHALFLPQKPHQPLPEAGEESAVASGLLAGRVTHTNEGGAYLAPRMPLLKGDLLRVGSEDDSWHQTIPIRKAIPKGGRLDIRPAVAKLRPAPAAEAGPSGKPGESGKSGKPGESGKAGKFGKSSPLKRKGLGKNARPFHPRGRRPGPRLPPKGTPVYLVDRREPELASRLGSMRAELAERREPAGVTSDFEPHMPAAAGRPKGTVNLIVQRALAAGKQTERGVKGLWMTPFTPEKCSPTLYPKIWWWLPPVIWPEEEESWKKALHKLVRDGGRRIVCNAPWQIGLLPDLGKVKPVAGPFCNLANPLALEEMRALGFDMAVVSPELGGEDILALPAQSPLPLGIVVSGYWPVGVTRYRSPLVNPQEPLSSPKGETFFTRPYGPLSWIFPAWPLDITARTEALEDAGYGVFIHLKEPQPRRVETPGRSSQFNWELGML